MLNLVSKEVHLFRQIEQVARLGVTMIEGSDTGSELSLLPLHDSKNSASGGLVGVWGRFFFGRRISEGNLENREV